MPELPEVQTTVNGLKEHVIGLLIKDVWTDYKSPFYYGKDNIKDPKYFEFFKKKVRGRKIIGVSRRAKNVLIHLSGDITILTHMKMTGHFLYGDYNKGPMSRFIHLIFYLSNDKNLEFSDMRKFATVTLSPHSKDIGPEPLDKSFTFTSFQKQIYKKSKGKIKPTLMDQSVIAGIGNIYADESLWRAGIHPESTVSSIPQKDLKSLYSAIRATLTRGIDFGGDSMSDYRNIYGEKGQFQEKHRAYRKTGTKCSKPNCGGTIVRKVIAGRSGHFCDTHQKLLKN